MSKRHLAIAILFLLLLPLVASANRINGAKYTSISRNDSTIVYGHISENTTWVLANSPYIVESDVVVEQNAYLVIAPGVVVKLCNGTNLVVDGALIAQGDSTHTIVFTSNSIVPQVGDWGGIHFRDTSIDDVCIIDWAVVEYGDIAVSSDHSSPQIANSLIHLNNMGYRIERGTIRICNSTFDQNSFGIYAENSYAYNDEPISNIVVENNIEGVRSVCDVTNPPIYLTVKDSTFVNNTYAWVEFHGRLSLVIQNSTFCHNVYSLSGVLTDVTVYESTFLENEWAIYGGSVKIVGSNVSNNNRGIFTGDATIYATNILGNNGTGVESGSLSISYSTVAENKQNGIVCGSTNNIRLCNICNNTPYDLVSGAGYGADINATNNWWGTTNQTLIYEHIFDYYDDYNLGKVFFQPYLTAPIEVNTVPPSIDHVLAKPTLPNYDEQVSVTATITANLDVDSALLGYSLGVTWQSVPMNNVSSLFNATIPAQPYGTLVQYKIFANDTLGNWVESDIQSYTVRDSAAPEIAFLDLKPTCPYPYVSSNVSRANEPTLVAANISEPVNASGVATCLFSYRADSGEWWNTTMTCNTTSALWMCLVPGQQGNSTIELFISTRDVAGNWATSSITSFRVKPLPLGDVTGDGITNMRDIQFCIIHFNEKTLELAILNFNNH